MLTRFIPFLFGILLLTGGLACGRGDAAGAEDAKPARVEEPEAEAPEAEADEEPEDEGPAAPFATSAEIDLGSVALMIRRGHVKDGEALERAINNTSKRVHELDVDGDGKVDKVTVVEVRDGAAARFELKVLPSSEKRRRDPGVYKTIAVIELEPVKADSRIRVTAYFTDAITHDERDGHSFETRARFREDRIVIRSSAFVSWVFTSRPPFHGVHYHVAVEAVGEGCWPVGHCTHAKWDTIEININTRSTKRRRRGGDDDGD